MNKRIKQLWEQSTGSAIPGPGFYASASDFNIEKFAELLVEKFDDILVLEQLDCVGNRDKQAEERIERLREKVKTYFGVEE